MTETRERYMTDSEAYGGPLFQVELIDSKGKSHGFIGYRFHAPGAQAAADGWNNQRERFDLVAVIKPFEEPKPAAIVDRINAWQHPLVEDKPDADGWIEWHRNRCPVDLSLLVQVVWREDSSESKVYIAREIDWSAITHYRLVNPPTPDWIVKPGPFYRPPHGGYPSKSERVASSIVRRLDQVASRRIVSEQIPSQNDVIVMHAMLRSHKHLLMRSLKACVKAIDGLPPYYMTKSLERARELAGQVLNQLE